MTLTWLDTTLLCVVGMIVLTPPKYDPAIWLKAWAERKSKERTAKMRRNKR